MTEAAATTAEDDVLALSRELDETNEKLAQLHAEHEALRKKSRKRAVPATKVVRVVDKPEVSGGAYRGPDAAIALRAAVARANSAVANLGIENAILQSQIDSRDAPPPGQLSPRLTLLIILGSIGACVLLAWLAADHVDSKTVRGIGATFAGLILVFRLLGFKRPSQR